MERSRERRSRNGFRRDHRLMSGGCPTLRTYGRARFVLPARGSGQRDGGACCPVGRLDAPGRQTPAAPTTSSVSSGRLVSAPDSSSTDHPLKAPDDEFAQRLFFLPGPVTKLLEKPRGKPDLEGLDVGGSVFRIGDHPARAGRRNLPGMARIGKWLGHRTSIFPVLAVSLTHPLAKSKLDGVGRHSNASSRSDEGRDGAGAREGSILVAGGTAYGTRSFGGPGIGSHAPAVASAGLRSGPAACASAFMNVSFRRACKKWPPAAGLTGRHFLRG